MAERDFLAVAYHEAGHAVVACVLGYPFTLVSIDPDPDDHRAGGVQWEPLRQSDVWQVSVGGDKADRALVILYAGAVAEARFDGVDFDDVWSGGGTQSDREALSSITGAMAKVIGLPRDLFALQARRRAEALIDLHWLRVEAVAAELVTHRRLSPSQVMKIVNLEEG